MKRKPEKGESLLLLGWAQGSRVGFSVPVKCVTAEESGAFHRPPARKLPVTVLLPGGQLLVVERRDLEPADPMVAERENSD